MLEVKRTLEKWLDKYSFARAFERKAPPISPYGVPYATFNRRMMASMIDTAIIALVLIPFNDLLMQFAYRDFFIDPAALEAIQQNAATPEQANAAALQLMIDSGLGTVFVRLCELQFYIFAAYSAIFWHFYSATPGKLVLGMRIIDEKTGAHMSGLQSLFRIMGYVLAGVPAMLGIFAIAWSKKKRGWHDWFAGTSVVVAPRKMVLTRSAPPAADPSDSRAPGAAE